MNDFILIIMILKKHAFINRDGLYVKFQINMFYVSDIKKK